MVELKKQGFFAIYDGHGGTTVVDYVVKNFHEQFLEEMKIVKDIQRAFFNTYKVVDQQIITKNIKHSGTTAVTALIREENGEKWLHVANCGDARAVLCRDGTAVRLSFDHKANEESETQRIRSGGSFVVNGRLGGSIAVSRSFGDIEFKKFGLIVDPYYSSTQLNSKDTILIIACDGLWDVAEDQEAVDLIKGDHDTKVMSEKLLNYALENGTKDNVTVMVIIL